MNKRWIRTRDFKEVVQFFPTTEVYVTGSKRQHGFGNDGDGGDIDDVELVNVLRTEYLYKYNDYGAISFEKAFDEHTARSAEFQDELGLNMYDMDMRQYDPAIARWIVLDPVVHHSRSPYNAFDNNPVFWADPSGADSEVGIDEFIRRIWKAADLNGGTYYWQNTTNDEGEGTDDDITVNSNGIIVNVIVNNKPNRFFDEQGNEHFFNDFEEVDALKLEEKFKVGDRLFFVLTTKEFMDYIVGMGTIPWYYGLQVRYAIAAKKKP